MRPASPRALNFALVYAALVTAVVSSLGMLLVPVVSTSMNVPISTAQWIITANLLVGAMTAPTMGRLADGPHKKRLLVVILTVTLIGSLIAALAVGFELLLIGRSLQGAAYGIVPIAITVARDRIPREGRAVIVATLSITVSMGLGIGYPLTGLAVGLLGMQAAFWMAAAFMVSGLVVVIALVPRDRVGGPAAPKFDFTGALLLTAALGAVVVGVSEGPVLGWTSPITLAVLGSGLVFAVLWITTSRRITAQFVDVRSLQIPDVSVTHGASFALAATIYLAMSTSSLVAQAPLDTGYGIALPALWAGFVILPLAVGSFVASRIIGAAMARIALIDILVIGSAVITIGQLALLLLHTAVWQLLVGMLIVGLGMGIVFAASPVLVARRVALGEVGSAVSFNQVVKTIGATMGSALAGSIFAAAVAGAGFPSAGGIGFAFSLGLAAAAAVTLALASYRWARGVLAP